MSSLSDNQRQKLIQEVFTCFQKSIGVVVDGRQSPQPTEDSTNRPAVSIGSCYSCDVHLPDDLTDDCNMCCVLGSC
jgi:hypothetical protein